MKNLNDNLIDIEEELKNSYINYSMSVIVSRALPDVRDGLKPVHRRILYAMNNLKNYYNKPYKKSARIVGDVIGKYHPHGDISVYDAIVRMAQKFSLRYPLIDGQGNFGSIDGDSAAAMRYTEIRMSKISKELLYDIDKNTIDFYKNYDDTELIPEILPSKIPNLLINGSYGIAVGMATNIPPHNISEIINGCIELIKNPDIDIIKLMKYIPGPDFPTGAIIHNKEDIKNVYKTGKGKICIKSKTTIEKDKENIKIIINEIPYQINKTKLIEKILESIKNKKVYGIKNIKDESNRKGIRIVLEIDNKYSEKVILNNLYINTPLKNNLYVNMVALIKNKPKLMSLKDILNEFIKFRKNIIYKKTIFLLEKDNKKINIIEGYIISILNIEKIINILKLSNSLEEAKKKLLISEFYINNLFIEYKLKYMENVLNKKITLSNKIFLNKIQIKYILDMKLQRLTNLEFNNTLKEYNDTIKNIENYISIIKNKDSINNIIIEELIYIKNEYKDNRLTKIVDNDLYIDNNLLIDNFKVIITLSYHGYIKYQPLSDYNSQKRGGKGKSSTKIKSEDFINCLLIAYTNDDILLFSNKGKMYKLKVFKLPESNKNTKGKPITNFISLEVDEIITTIISLNFKNLKDNNYILMVTLRGFIKKILIKNLIKNRNSGFIVIKLNKDDKLISVNITNGNNDIMLFSSSGKSVRFSEKEIRVTNRTSIGIKGMNINKNDKIVSLIIPNIDDYILIILNNGYGKITHNNQYISKSRGLQGVTTIKIKDKNKNKVIKSISVNEKDEILIITDNGTIVRIKVSEIRMSKRNTSGVKLIKVYNNENVVDVKKVINNI